MTEPSRGPRTSRYSRDDDVAAGRCRGAPNPTPHRRPQPHRRCHPTAVEAGSTDWCTCSWTGPTPRRSSTQVAASGAFVTPCIVLNASMMGITGSRLRRRPPRQLQARRVLDRNPESSYNRYPQGSLDDVLASVRALHDAGVDILVGTDVSFPLPTLGGMAHGASVHHELQMLVQAGLSPSEALRAATATPARRFGLDRSRTNPRRHPRRLTPRRRRPHNEYLRHAQHPPDLAPRHRTRTSTYRCPVKDPLRALRVVSPNAQLSELVFFRAPRMQNSLPSGSSSTVHGCSP